MHPVALLGIGLALGIRHAADPDHVVAVTAITARTRGVLGAAWLGVVWGLGHTLTLFAVGAAIILFNLVVPPRVGLVHGLAGSAAVALLVLASVRDPRWATLYLLVFGAGTLLGMALITTSIATPLAAATRRWSGFGRAARLATGTLSLLFGAWLIWQIGWRDGLFLATPVWTPH